MPGPRDPALRFSSRVGNYARFRPGYPRELLALLQRECGLTPSSIVADLGSGTGILTELFLLHGNPVFAIEPNAEMRAAAELRLSRFPGFSSLAASAEATSLDSASVDFITAAQAFHWFRRDEARREFARVLRPGGWAVIVWNQRRTSGTAFLEAYEQLLRGLGSDYLDVSHSYHLYPDMESFFAPHAMRTASFPNSQDFDLEGLKGRLLSSSYTPEPGDPGYAAMLAGLEHIFAVHSRHGSVRFLYDTQVYYCLFSP